MNHVLELINYKIEKQRVENRVAQLVELSSE